MAHYCNHVNLYWITSESDVERISEMLNGPLKGNLHQNMLDRHIMNRIPLITFVYDTHENHLQEIERLLKIADYGEDFVPNDPTLFETPYETLSKSSGKPPGKQNAIEVTYDCIKLQKPPDMKMDVFGLEYEKIMNIVLENLNKSRAQHRSFNAVADPLPPPDWFNQIKPPQDEPVYDTDFRLKMMKKFLVDNRKKRQRLSRTARKNEILEKLSIDEEMNIAKMRYDLNQGVDRVEDEDISDYRESVDEN